MISPLLANLYLHWFDTVFHRSGGPAHWAKAKLVRYADDFVVLVRQPSQKLVDWIEAKLETWMGLEINREKTRLVELKQKGASLDFLGFTFRWERSRLGPGHYWNVTPSDKSLAARAGQTEGADQRTPQLLADSDADSGAEPASERLGELLSLWLPERSFCQDQPLRTSPSLAAPEETQPATVSNAAGESAPTSTINSWGWRPLRAAVAQLPAKPKATVSAKAGCGKSARPV